MKKEFIYLSREVCVYGLSVNRWYVTVSKSHLLTGDDKRATWTSKRAAVIAAHDFVKALTEDEV